jgi:LytS/YehU family sensor histidine kinase
MTNQEDISPCLDGTIPLNYYDLLLARSKDYMRFMNEVGTLEDQSYEQEIPQLFTADLQKIANGKILLKGSQLLPLQLSSAREKCGKAEIKLLDITVSTHDYITVLNYIFETEKIGSYITMASLHFNDKLQIDRVTEVFNVYNDGW